MRKVSIYQVGNNHDLKLMDLDPEVEELILDEVNNIKASEAYDLIHHWINTGALKDEDRLVNYYFDEDETLLEVVKETVMEFLA